MNKSKAIKLDLSWTREHNVNENDNYVNNNNNNNIGWK